MIDQITIKNFRGFVSQQVSGLKRVNVIVGKNSTGKTAFLEAIFISSAAQAPRGFLTLKNMRHLGPNIEIRNDKTGYEALWQDMFNRYDQQATVTIEIHGSSGDSRTLVVSYGEPESPILPFGKQPMPKESLLPQIVFKWIREKEGECIVRPKIVDGGIKLEGATMDLFPIMFFSSFMPETPEENAKRFSELSKEGKAHLVVDALKREFPFVESLSVEYNIGTPAIHANITGMERKIPVGLISSGVHKLLGILLGIASTPRGVILIDQIEDGFYFSTMSSIWKSIYGLARDADVQIFATTHSMEFLKAMQETMQGHEDDFALLHAQRENGSPSTLRTINGKFLEASLEQGIEIR